MGIVCKPPLIGIIKKTVANKKTGACIQFPLVIFSLFLWMVFLNILINAYEAINQKIRPEIIWKVETDASITSGVFI